MTTNKWKYPTNTLTYNSWRSMRLRVAKSPHYKNISICERWSSFDNFMEDMGERPAGTTIDRIDGTKDYEPGNCRWADWHTQENNKASLRKVENAGVSLTIGQWCTLLGLSDRMKARVYKRVSKYSATTWAELFTPERLSSVRISQRHNECVECGRTQSCKWRKDGTQCNTCYHRHFRAGYATLAENELID